MSFLYYILVYSTQAFIINSLWKWPCLFIDACSWKNELNLDSRIDDSFEHILNFLWKWHFFSIDAHSWPIALKSDSQSWLYWLFYLRWASPLSILLLCRLNFSLKCLIILDILGFLIDGEEITIKSATAWHFYLHSYSALVLWYIKSREDHVMVPMPIFR